MEVGHGVIVRGRLKKELEPIGREFYISIVEDAKSESEVVSAQGE